MKSVTITTASNQQINWLVAHTLGHKLHKFENEWLCQWPPTCGGWDRFMPSTNPLHMVVLMELMVQDGFEIRKAHYSGKVQCVKVKNDRCTAGYGPTVLVACCRAYLTEYLGTTAEVPEELT